MCFVNVNVDVVTFALLIESLNLHTKVDLHASQTVERQQIVSIPVPVRVEDHIPIHIVASSRSSCSHVVVVAAVTMKNRQVAAVNSL